MLSQPKLEQRNAQPTVAVRTQVAIPFGVLLPPMWDEVSAWLAKKGIATAGAPYIRYLTTDMEKKLDIEVGFPVATAAIGNGRIVAGVLPAGCYAVLMYTGPYEGDGVFKANVALLEWAQENNIAWQISTKNNVEWWGARLEFYLTNPEREFDTQKYRTELAFMVAEA